MRSPNATILMLTAISVIAVDTLDANRLIRLVDSALAEQTIGSEDLSELGVVDAPDLVPTDDQGNPPMGQNPVRYCQRDASGALVVKVKNQGLEDADTRFLIEVDYVGARPRSVVEEPVGIPAGETRSYVMPNPIPSGCFRPDCIFIIAVNGNRQERDEINIGNNRALGRCIG